MMQRRPPIHVQRVDFGAHLDQFLNNKYLVALHENGVVQWRAAAVVLHPHYFCCVPLSQERQQLGLAGVDGIVKRRPATIISPLWVGSVLQKDLGHERVAYLAGIMQWRLQQSIAGRDWRFLAQKVLDEVEVPVLCRDM